MKESSKAFAQSTIAPRVIGLGKPVVVGSLLAVALLLVLRAGLVPSPFLNRYLLGHPVSLIETAMLAVGLCFLAYKWLGLRKEAQAIATWNIDLKNLWRTRRNDLVGSNTDSTNSESLSIRQRVEEVARQHEKEEESEDFQIADHLLSRLSASGQRKQSSLYQRIYSALEFIRSRRSAEGIDEHLKHLSNQDLDVQHDNFSLVRLMIWAIPMLGFLGTVIGISEALGGLDFGNSSDLSGMIGSLKSSLYVAFDTTALALCFGVVLMFLQFGIERKETRLLQQVDTICEKQILQVFRIESEDRDPVARSIQKMGQALLKATFSLVEHQHDLWNESLVSAQDAWITATENAKNQSETHLKEILDAAGDGLAIRLASALEVADKRLNHRWQQWQVSLSENTRTLAAYQENAASHLDMLEKFFQTASDLSADQRERVDVLTERLSNWIDSAQSNQSNQTEFHDQLIQKVDQTNHLLGQVQENSQQSFTHNSEAIEKITESFNGSIAKSFAEISAKVDSQAKDFEAAVARKEAAIATNSEVVEDVSVEQAANRSLNTRSEPFAKVRSVPGRIGKVRIKPQVKALPEPAKLSEEEIIANSLLGSTEANAAGSNAVVLPFPSEGRLGEVKSISSDLKSHSVIQNQNRSGQIVIQDTQETQPFLGTFFEPVVESKEEEVSDEVLKVESELLANESHQVSSDRVEVGLQEKEQIEAELDENHDVRSVLVPFEDARIHRTA